MKKKFLVTMITMLMGLSIVACGKSQDDDFYNTNEGCSDCDICCVEEDGSTGLTVEDPKAETTISSDVFDISISVMDDGDEVLNRLKEEFGDPTDTSADGDFHTDTFDDISVTYSETDGKKEIVEFKCVSDRYKTNKGITIGSTLDEVKNAYGEVICEYDDEDGHHLNYIYDDGFSIYFTFANDEVITYQVVCGRG
ncbi:hypothetical protein SAMN02910298_00118 [Pseudobutyrivibrio sp. YE44]|uniref:hypothetical protein n=1 Tax=Pseudobutyrivibrio sp. YE44 TaxID=1520802 RepID=UPI00088C3660|nr:hypothetical protein [Pseudobutyrivibrio sp. YE44]SDB05476.1 hypothetical protein SAMN02910298_00118 [Pseudobutyrivibrio sp. YE44]